MEVSQETTRRTAVRVHAEYRFGLVLLLLLATFVFMAASPTGDWSRLVTLLLQGATLIAALLAAAVPRRLVHLAVLATVVAVIAIAVTALISGTDLGGIVAVLDALLVATAATAIVWSILRRRVIDVRTVLGALCIYVLLGMFWAFVFSAIGAFGSDPFFVQESNPTSADYLYFAFVTLTTVGYGDLTAAGGFGRALAVLDALFGQIYLVTVVALLVSNMGRRGIPRAHEGSEG
jgi:drug/metabolite transporter (DMT)-like permease